MNINDRLDMFSDVNEIADALRKISKELTPDKAYFLVEASVNLKALFDLCNELATVRDKKDRIGKLDDLPDAAMLNDRELAELLGISPTTIWRWVRAGRFPNPIRFGMRCTRWNVGEVRRCIALMKNAGN